MQTRSAVQHQVQSESSHAPTVQLSSRSWADSHHAPMPTANLDFSTLDLFSHAPKRSTGRPRVTPSIQAKLAMGQPNDPYEQEADRVADQVLSMPAPAPVQRQAHPQQAKSGIQTKPLAATITPIVQRMETESGKAEDEPMQAKFIQRMDAPSEEDEPMQAKFIQRMDAPSEEDEPMQAKFIQRMDAPSEEDEPMQAKSTHSGSHTATPALEQQLHTSKGSGSPLPDEVRSFMEPRFGADFSQVRVHTNDTAVQMNQDLQAHAFTHGQDIFFGSGKHPSNDALTAHELTHVIQQTGRIDRPIVQRDDTDQSSAPPTRGRRNAISHTLGGGGLDRMRNLAKVRQLTPDGLDLSDDPSTKSTAEEATDEAVDVTSSVYEVVTDTLDDDNKAVVGETGTAVGTGVGAVSGLLDLYTAIQQIRGGDIDQKIEGIFGVASSVASGVESASDIAKDLSEEGSSASAGADMAASVGGSVADGIGAIKTLVLTVKGVYDAYKAATSPEGSSTKEKLMTGLNTVKGLVEAASDAVKVGKTIVELLDQASGGLTAAVPGLSIALSAVNIAIDVFNIIKAKTSENFVNNLLKSNYWKQSNVFGKGKQGRQQRSEYAKTYEAEIAKMKTKLGTLTDPRAIAELQSLIRLAETQLAALEENAALTNLADVNSDRVMDAGFDIGVNMVKIVGDVLNLVPEPNTQIASVSLKAAAAGASVTKKIASKGRQLARDYAAKHPDSILSRVVDVTQTTDAKMERRKATVKYLFGQIAALPPANAPEFAAQEARVEQLIEATGMSPQALYRTVRTEGLDAAIKSLVKAQGE